ncbi:MAG: FAD-binding protein [Acidobacteria bacterium]|nr:MAG: FAD-binding protein [Acidobacteriota bacterium]REK02801.1 MAG: FAD-binding protein [Acidobacteriota bacterium]REK13395.1 MAG: FAD-binding protein [Acidobacteriota bacterium]REK41389.1 MAG: FAD-binding protein [Acidobacteriota bacterium]
MYESIHFKSSGRATTTASDPEVLSALGKIVGETNLIIDPEKVEPYGADAVKEKFPPEAVLFPENAEQVSEILRLANEHDFPVTARGGGVGYTGGAVPIEGGIVIGTDRMNRILEINDDDLYAVCQPGIRTIELQEAAAEKGLLFAPDPASYKDSYIGGNIAENAGGMRTPKYGVTKHSVLGLEFVTATGEIIRTGGKTVKNVVGFDLTGLICGSEGMLGIITEATLKLIPMPEATSTVRASFRSMEEACGVLTRFTPEGLLPMAMEVIDRKSIGAIEENYAFGFSGDTEAILLVAVDGDREQVDRDSRRIERILGENGGFDIIRSESKEDENRLWDARRAISPSLMKYGSLKINEDVVVPRSKVPELIRKIDAIGEKHGTFIANFGHAGDGNIHVNFMCFRDDPDSIERARRAVRETFELSVELGGTISGEHGIGYVKAPYLDIAVDQATLEVMRKIKKLFDPNGILNPGKMFV